MMRADTGLKMCLSVCAYHIPSKNRISCILSPQPFYARRLIANKIYILSYMSTALRSPSRSTRVHARTAYTNTHTHIHSAAQQHSHTRNRIHRNATEKHVGCHCISPPCVRALTIGVLRRLCIHKSHTSCDICVCIDSTHHPLSRRHLPTALFSF